MRQIPRARQGKGSTALRDSEAGVLVPRASHAPSDRDLRPSPPDTSWRTLALTCLIVLVAFGLRTMLIGSQSLWLDEGDSLAFAQRDLVGLARSFFRIGENGPLYFFMLHFWIQLAGTSELSLRLPSTLIGTLTVPLAIVFGRRLGGRPLALVFGVVTACSYYLVWYARDACMYSTVVFLSLLASYLLVRGLQQPRRIVWVSYAIALSLALYVHLFDVFLIGFHIGFVLLYMVWSRRRPVGALLSLASVTIPYIPLGVWQLPTLLQPPDTTFQYRFQPLRVILLDLISVVSVSSSGPILIGLVALACGGLVALLRSGRQPQIGSQWPRPIGGIFVALYLAVPVLAYYPISALIPSFTVRYLSLLVPAYLLLLAGGIVGLGRLFRPLGWVALIGLLALWLPHSFDNSVLKENWRAAAEHTSALARPDDVFVFIPPNGETLFRYYIGGDVAAVSLPLQSPIAYDTGAIPATLDRAAQGKRGVWLVQTHLGYWPTAQPIFDWLSSHARHQSRARWDAGNPITWMDGITVDYYLLDRGSTPTGPSAPLATFDGKLDLQHWSSERQTARAGEYLALSLDWLARAKLDVNYRLSVRLIDDQNRVWGKVDQETAGPFFSSTSWQAGKPVHAIVNLPIDPGTPAGTYRLELLVYGGPAEPVLVATPDQPAQRRPLDLGTLTVARPAIVQHDWKPMGQSIDVDFGGRLQLIALASPTPAEAAAAAAGRQVKVSTYWRVLSHLDRSPRVRIHVGGEETTVVEGVWPVAAGNGPWRPGEIVRLDQNLTIPAAAESGPAALSLAVIDDTGNALPIRWHGLTLPWSPKELTVESLSIHSRPHQFAKPDLEHQVDAQFDQGIKLLGYQLADEPARPGQDLPITLFWQTTQTPSVDYTVFVHLARPGEPPIAQRDEAPDGGYLATTSWVPGEIIQDKKRLSIPSTLPPGTYQLLVGLYDPSNGHRLSVENGGDSVVLRTFTIPAQK